MKQDDIDRILSKETEILPSSGFTHSVMDAVRSEAATPPPIPFPWMRALPGIVAGAGTLIYATIGFVLQLRSSTYIPKISPEWESTIAPIVNAIVSPEAGWVALALCLSFASAVLPGKVISRKA